MRMMVAMAALAAACSASAAPIAGAETVEITILRDGRIVGKPTLTVVPGDVVTAEVSGTQGYRIEVLLTRADDMRMVGLKLSLPRDGQWQLVAAPTIVQAPGVEGRVRIDGSPAIELRTTVTAPRR